MLRFRVSLLFVLLSGFVLSLSGGIWAEEKQDYHQLTPDLRFDASLRLRGEIKNDVLFNNALPGNDDEYLLSRLRIGLTWNPSEVFKAFIEGQDARIYFDDQVNETAVPTIFADALDLHQAYFVIDCSDISLPLKLRLGRQKLIYGQQRLIGAFEWANTARVFDAVKVTLGNEDDRHVDIFSTRIIPVDHHNFNDWSTTGNRNADSDFHGIYYVDRMLIPNTRLEAYGLLRHESEANDEVYSLGTRFEWKTGPFDADGEFVGQFGDFGQGMDHEAFALHLGGGYRAKGLNKTRFGLAYNYATGDDDPNDNTHKTFDNLFPTNHLHYGYMDLMSWRNMHNVELNARTLWGKLDARVAYHLFWLDEEDTDAWFNAGGGQVRNATGTGANPDSFLGQEVDVLIKYPVWKDKVTLEAGYSRFFGGDYLEDLDSDEDADFAYFQTLLKF